MMRKINNEQNISLKRNFKIQQLNKHQYIMLWEGKS